MFFLASLIWLAASLAFGQEPDKYEHVAVPFLDQLLNTDFLAKLIAFGAIVQLACYFVAEILTRVSAWLDTKSPAQVWLKKATAVASQASWFLGVLLGKVGYSVPKLVIEEKAKELSEKQTTAK